MRTYTLLVSIAAHVVFAIVVIAKTVLATDVLPEPRHATEVIVVTPELPKPPPESPRVQQRLAQPASANVAPIEAPVGVRPEPVFDAPADSVAAIDGLVIGDPSGLVVNEPPPPAPSVAPAARVPLRPGGIVSQPRRTYYAAPSYPAIAQAARVSGIVILEAVIGEDGTVRDVRVLRSTPLLDQAAIDAVKQWRYTPTLLNGQPVPIVMTVTVGFDLH